MTNNISWLQISDLHIFESTDWNLMKQSYEKLAKIVHPSFIVITGDFRHLKLNPDYRPALDFLNCIIKIFNIKKTDLFLVPGNHDVNGYKHRKEIITTINSTINEDVDSYMAYMRGDEDDLRNAFQDYRSFLKEFYSGAVSDNTINNMANITCIKWRKKVNILCLNTALISQGIADEKQIVDIRKLSQIRIDYKLPTIVLAHHDIDSIIDSQKQRMISILNNLNVKVYLCGDEHKLGKRAINIIDSPNLTMPRFICGKSAVQTSDNFSDICVIEYQCNPNGNAYVQVYKYDCSHGFEITSDFYYNIEERFNFQMFSVDDSRNDDSRPQKNLPRQKKTPQSIWLPDAEKAKGKQTRFNSFTNTDKISNFFEYNSGYLGIASVKGIGKTFLLQVKRVKSAKKYYCLPNCPLPSAENNWATERVSFDTYAQLKSNNKSKDNNNFDSLVLLWKMSIKCYVINNLINEENKRTVFEYFEKGNIDQCVVNWCTDDLYQSLETLMSTIVNQENWNEIVYNQQTHVSNLCRISLIRRKKANPSAKNIAIFIDKVDQSIKQTNAEPPADCVSCKKSNNVIECKSSRKSAEYCSSEDGCKSKNCCYGCEVFASPRSNDGLRIYSKSNAAKLIHVNIWQYLQLSLMSAAEQISEEFSGKILVFYTMRQEAFNCESNLLGEQNQKIASKVIQLNYSRSDQEKIFLDCIRNQDQYYLFAPEALTEKGHEEFAFVGVNSLCHPYCKDNNGNYQKESVFMSIFRHSFDRSRDIQRYGEELTKNIGKIRGCKTEHDREEEVKKTIENLAASLAYCSKQSESTVNPSYYTEKMHFLPNYWADNENFERLLSMIDRNLLFENDIKRICCKINGVEQCPATCCRLAKCKRHPFSMLYRMGYLGYIQKNDSHSGFQEQHFLNSSDVSYFTEADDLIISEREAYIIHPALTKTIEKKYYKSFLHFSGFILGKDLGVDPDLFTQILEDKKKMENDSFVKKYYFIP